MNWRPRDSTAGEECPIVEEAFEYLKSVLKGTYTYAPRQIYVCRLPQETTEDELAKYFSQYGKVTKAEIKVDRAKRSRGYGFVTFETEKEAFFAVHEAQKEQEEEEADLEEEEGEDGQKKSWAVNFGNFCVSLYLLPSFCVMAFIFF